MILVATRKSEQNRAMLDPWTVVHLGAGLAAGLMGFAFVPVMLAAAGYEVAEQIAESTDAGRRMFKTSGPEQPANVAADLVVLGVGWWLGQRYNRS